ncbi:jg4130, partial [Pararge aegeria aegeria]
MELEYGPIPLFQCEMAALSLHCDLFQATNETNIYRGLEAALSLIKKGVNQGNENAVDEPVKKR